MNIVDVRELRVLGQRTRQFRRASGLTKKALAVRANVAPSTISRIESADQTGYNPHVTTLAVIAKALDVKVGELTNRGHVIPL